ncbi:hypothetical protein PMIN05_000035 [Paraphaeosphaeria minitans]
MGLSGRIKGDSHIRNARMSFKVEVLDDISEATDGDVYQSLFDDLKAEAEEDEGCCSGHGTG